MPVLPRDALNNSSSVACRRVEQDLKDSVDEAGKAIRKISGHRAATPWVVGCWVVSRSRNAGGLTQCCIAIQHPDLGNEGTLHERELFHDVRHLLEPLVEDTIPTWAMWLTIVSIEVEPNIH